MSKKTFNSRTKLTTTFDEFHGISALAPGENHSPKKIINFRILEDGSLQKRCGVRALLRFPEKIRAHWSGTLDGNFQVYFLAGNTLYLTSLKYKSYEIIGTVSTSVGDAIFFCLQGTLYLNDGENLYRLHGKELRKAIGYVPLYGDDWDNDEMGEVNEPFNILNQHIRITYHVSDPPSIFLRVPKIIKSVEAIWRNGVRLTSEEFSHNKEFNTITVSDLAANDRLEVYLTVETDHGDLRDLFSSVRGTVFFGSAEKSRNFFFGGTRSDTIFCSEHVAPADLDKACLIYDSDPLYLPEGNEFRIPEQRLPIQNVLRHKDNLLIFTEKDTWLAGGDSTGHTPLPSVLINSELGCISPTGALLVQNDPITVGRHGLYRWESPDPALTHRDTVRISKALDFFLTTDDLSTATLFYDSMRDELLLNLPKRKELWICARKRQEWFCFHGITAERFFDADGQIGFFADDTVSIFDPTLSFDLDLDGGIKLISAVYESASFDFGTDAKKNLSEFSFCGDLDTGFLTLSVTTDTGENLSHTITDVLNREHASLTARMRSGRFQNATFELSHNGQYLPVIHSLSLTAH